MNESENTDEAIDEIAALAKKQIEEQERSSGMMNSSVTTSK
jgi:hypothetical protein